MAGTATDITRQPVAAAAGPTTPIQLLGFESGDPKPRIGFVPSLIIFLVRTIGLFDFFFS